MVVVTRFVLALGKIEERRELDTDIMNPELMAHARRVLSDLRSGKETWINPIPTDAAMEVRLGSGLKCSTYQEEIDRLTGMDYPASRTQLTAFYQTHWEEERLNSFVLVLAGEFYALRVVRTRYSDWWRLFYHVLQSRIPRDLEKLREFSEQLSEYGIDRQQEDWNVMREIAACRPAFTAPTQLPDEISQFGDCFAAAMLHMRVPREPNYWSVGSKFSSQLRKDKSIHRP